MNLLRYDAIAIGDLDLLLGPTVLQQRIAEAEFPVLSANVQLAGEETLLADPYVILTRGDHHIGIIGVTWDAADVSPDQFTVLKAEDVLAHYVPEVAQQADIIIVLSTMGFEEDQALSFEVSDADLFVGGRSRVPLPESWRNPETGALVVQAGSQGEWIGQRVLSLDSSGVVTAHQDQLILLTDSYPDDPEMRSFLDNYPAQ